MTGIFYLTASFKDKKKSRKIPVGYYSKRPKEDVSKNDEKYNVTTGWPVAMM